MADDGLGPSALEREIERLPEVRAARVVAGPGGRILEIHLVSDGTKAPKQLTRDVETVAATQGLDIDRRTISIAQMPEGSEPASTQALTLSSIALTTEGHQTTCRVRVARSESEGIGEGWSPATSSGRTRLIATSTLDAVSSLLGSRLPADCDNALLVDVGAHRIAVAVLIFVGTDGSQDVVPGVHPVRGDPDEAVAHAVLDAINRRNVV